MPHAPLPANARRFIRFRVLFNARFYYPVFAIFFVDLGLTLDQFALLNVAWAVSIVLCELPLGALGDQIGRKPLVVAAAAIMVVEMSVLAFFDAADPQLLFYVFLVNRFLSGAAEAAASGADEALAYDTLKEAGREGEWPRVLSIMGRSMSVAFVCAMILGALVYDPAVMQAAANRLGLQVELTQRITARFPVYLTLVLALGALWTSLRMREPGVAEAEADASPKARPTLGASVRTVLDAGRWIARTRFALGLILFALVIDSVIRLYLTVTSPYFRLLEVPTGWYGPLTAGFSAVGFAAPWFAKRAVERWSPGFNFTIVVAVGTVGLAGVAAIRSPLGLLSILPLAAAFHLLGFFGSQYLNRVTASSQRATVLSFKSLAGNLAYGAIGWGFAELLRQLARGGPVTAGSPEEAAVFSEALWALPIALGALGAVLLVYAARDPQMRARPTPIDADDAEAEGSPLPAIEAAST